jgi:hypothetical protein
MAHGRGPAPAVPGPAPGPQEQVCELIVAIAKIDSGPGYLEPMLQTVLDGLRPPHGG